MILNENLITKEKKRKTYQLGRDYVERTIFQRSFSCNGRKICYMRVNTSLSTFLLAEIRFSKPETQTRRTKGWGLVSRAQSSGRISFSFFLPLSLSFSLTSASLPHQVDAETATLHEISHSHSRAILILQA